MAKFRRHVPVLRRFCPMCDVKLSEADHECGYCTQCGRILRYTPQTIAYYLLRIIEHGNKRHVRWTSKKR